MALRRRLTDPSALGLYAQAVKGRHGAARLRKLVDVTAPAESPMETRLRWMLLEAGLPRPEVQTNLHDAEGNFIARADLYYPAARLVIEYDGSTHKTSLAEDNQRQNRLVQAGYRLLRFTAGDLHNRPQGAVAQVRSLLAVSNRKSVR
jgi:very-short-patch-repair endonuclease